MADRRLEILRGAGFGRRSRLDEAGMFPMPAHARGNIRLEQPSDDELVAAVASGDEAACRALMDRHLTRILALARRMLGNQADAEEVAQEVFLRVWTHADRWEPGQARFGTWLHRVATNLCLDRLRKNRPTDDIDEMPDLASGDPAWVQTRRKTS